MLTLNQLVEIIKTKALNHAQINSFYFGHPDEVNTGSPLFFYGGTEGATPIYPLVGITLISNNKTGKLKTTTLNMWVADLVHKDDSNRTEVLSDTDTIICELHDQIRSYLQTTYPATLNESFNTGPFQESWDDEVTGNQGELTIEQGNTRDTCIIPIKS